ncbi:peroxisomal ATPase PEX1 isoform X2 [Bacillus rossius redtenbacheri]|uniref:peroxisomal ATPase PEX1 isoform X2 n=1 Tax=Bacillus rossius redtenbacheri TaxID=93214 RepID=UPI002FDECF98
MKKNVFSIKFISVKNCFVYFSENWLRKLNDTHRNIGALLVEYGHDRKAYFSWSAEAGPAGDDSVVCLGATYARLLGVEEGERVVVSLLPQVPPLSCVHVSPLSSDDWQILMLKSDAVQSSVLDQVRVVWPGQVLVIWVSKSFHLRITVDTVQPSHAFGVLQPLTEVVVSSPGATAIPGVPFRESIVGSPSAVGVTTRANAPDQGVLARLFSGARKWLARKPVPGDEGPRGGPEEERSCGSPGDDTSKQFASAGTKKASSCVLRVHPMQAPGVGTTGLLDHPYNVYVSRECLASLGVGVPTDGTVLVGKISRVAYPKPTADRTTSSPGEDPVKSGARETAPLANERQHIFARLCVPEGEAEVLASQLADHRRHWCALFPRPAMAALRLAPGVKVHLGLVPAEEPPPAATELHVAPCGDWDESLGSMDAALRRHLALLTRTSCLLLNSDSTLAVPVTPGDARDLVAKVARPSGADYAALDRRGAASCRLTVVGGAGEAAAAGGSDGEEPRDTEVEGKLCGSFNNLLEEGLATLRLGLQIHQAANSLQFANTALALMNVLIVGKTGSGKSTISKALCRELGKPPHCVHSVHIQCRYLKGKKAETLQGLTARRLEECALRQPSVLVLDDLEALVGAPEDATSAEGLHCSRVAERLVDLLRQFQSANDISVVATTTSLKKLHRSVLAPRGRHVFLTVLEIPELTKADRLMSLEHILSQTCTDGILPPVSLATFANQTEGYVIQDLVDLVDKAMFQMWKRSGAPGVPLCPGAAVGDDGHPRLTDRDLEEAKERMVPLSLRGVSLFRDPGVSWEDVGGLADVKRALEQILMWPSQYPELFARCPLRHQSGVLLYGAPGTGKTRLAGAVARHCGLNFISVKGPELLSKYIGASEEAVRNIFEKAQSAKPCILFFDEFDSLAPRRGHDSTGVTDRVVNQLLTQLDGAESLEGVWVVAATGRPDLLDPALLRPGRLDRALLCPLPQQDDRTSILKALSRNLLLAGGVDLEEIAARTAGFTGADLQALLYTAQLLATDVAKSSLPDLLPPCSGMEVSSKTNDERAARERPAVSQAHLLAALEDTRPSLSPRETLKHQLIYQKFSNSMAGSAAVEAGAMPQRATLA